MGHYNDKIWFRNKKCLRIKQQFTYDAEIRVQAVSAWIYWNHCSFLLNRLTALMFNIPFGTKIGHFERVLPSHSLSLYRRAFFWTVLLPAKQLTSKVIFKTTNCVDGRENKSDLSSIFGYFETNEISAYFRTK